MTTEPLANSVFHPSDFSDESLVAFAHALAIALVRRSELTIMHAEGGRGRDQNFAGFPSVTKSLVSWGQLEPGSPSSAVMDELKLLVRKVRVRGRNPVRAIRGYLAEHPTDLIVLATEGRDGLPAWLSPSKAERVARKTRVTTLFVPRGARGFVSLADGGLRLDRILVPVDEAPDPTAALQYARKAFGVSKDGGAPAELVMLHVGDDAEMPLVAPSGSRPFTTTWVTRKGDAVEEILGVAEELRVDAIAMATEGRRGFLDALRGSVTEQVLRRSPCCVLAVPTD